VRNLIAGYNKLSPCLQGALGLMISTQSACTLDYIPSSGVDYIFTDPPYGDNVQYGELNFVWESWLGFDTSWSEEEIIVTNAGQGRGRLGAL